MTLTKFAFVVVVATIAAAAATALAADNSVTLRAAYSSLQRSNNTAFGISTVDATRVLTDMSGAFGYATVATIAPLYMDSKFRAGSAGELFVATIVLSLVAQSVLPALDTALTANLLPGSIPFSNPSFTANPLTLRHLLTHTSTLLDSARWLTFALNTPSTVLDLTAFCNIYFVSGSAGSYSVATDIWTATAPGSATSYSYAKANIALLMFIVERALVLQPTLVQSSSKTVLAYVAEKIWLPLGMSNTFVRLIDGSVPKSTYPAGADVFPATSIVTDTTVTGASLTSLPLHPAYFAESMCYTTPSDMSRLLRSLFADSAGIFRAVGSVMRQGVIDLTTFPVTKSTAQKGIGLGIKMYDGSQICALATASGVVSSCPLSSTSNVWGVESAGPFSQLVGICSDASASATVFCTTVAVAHSQGVKTLVAPLSMAGIVMQLGFGDQSTSSVIVSSSTRDDLYALWVALAVGGVLVLVFFAAWGTEYVVGEAPVASGVAMPTNQLPQMTRA